MFWECKASILTHLWEPYQADHINKLFQFADKILLHFVLAVWPLHIKIDSSYSS